MIPAEKGDRAVGVVVDERVGVVVVGEPRAAGEFTLVHLHLQHKTLPASPSPPPPPHRPPPFPPTPTSALLLSFMLLTIHPSTPEQWYLPFCTALMALFSRSCRVWCGLQKRLLALPSPCASSALLASFILTFPGLDALWTAGVLTAQEEATRGVAGEEDLHRIRLRDR